MNSLSDEIKVIVFDVDGTIMDSIGRIVECMQAAVNIENYNFYFIR